MSETPDETPQGDEQETPAEPEPPAVPTPDEDEDEAHEDEEVEGQQGDGDELPEASRPQDVPGQPQALSEREIEERSKKLDKEAMRHANRVQEIVGEDYAALHPCELCHPIIPGFHFAQIPDEQRAAVMLLLGISDVGNYASDTHSRPCDECQGWGMVATGSKVVGQDALPCMKCSGKGWLGDRETQMTVTATAAPPVPQENGDMQFVPHPPEVEEAIRIARAHGAIVIEPTVPAPA